MLKKNSPDYDLDARVGNLEQRCINLDARIDKVFAQANSTQGSLKQLRNVVALLKDGADSEVIVVAFPDWRAIETAPTHERVLFTDGTEIWIATKYVVDDVVGLKLADNPTHWMPLPEPPLVEKNASA